MRLRGVPEVLAEEPEVVAEAAEVAAEAARAGPSPPAPAPRCAARGVRGRSPAGRRRSSSARPGRPSARGRRPRGSARRRLVVADDGLVVDVLGRDVHEREVVGALVGQDVLAGDVVDVLAHARDERLPRASALLVVGRPRAAGGSPRAGTSRRSGRARRRGARRRRRARRSGSACCSVKCAGGSTCARRSPRRSSPRPPRSFGARRMSCSDDDVAPDLVDLAPSPRAARRGRAAPRRRPGRVVEPLAERGLRALHERRRSRAAARSAASVSCAICWPTSCPWPGERLAELRAERVELLLEEERAPSAVVAPRGAAHEQPGEHQRRQRRHGHSPPPRATFRSPSRPVPPVPPVARGRRYRQRARVLGELFELPEPPHPHPPLGQRGVRELRPAQPTTDAGKNRRGSARGAAGPSAAAAPGTMSANAMTSPTATHC